MESELDENGILDCVVFNTSSTQNSYEVHVCSKGKIVAVASGPLDQLALYLSEAKGSQTNKSGTSFKLQPLESQKGFSWFSKATLERFLHIVNMPEALNAANTIEGEMSKLEETKKFHISLYAKDQDRSAGGTTDNNCLKEAGRNHQIKVETASSDATKNELLRALDLRLEALGEKLSTSFNQAAGATCSPQQIADLLAFTEHFGAVNLRNFLLKLLVRRPKNQPPDSSVVQSVSLQDIRNNVGNPTRAISHPASQTLVEPVKIGVSPAKIAQVERQSSSESEESSDSSDDDQSHTERSRSLIRSATPRRSASPMRRIQIGRSGSRRSTSLTIKSLSYFPARERTTSTRDNDGNNSGDEDADQPPKKPENPVRRMSVQDAISLFEGKQKDQKLDIQKRRASGEVSASVTAKSVLRRWSAGMGDSFTHSSHEDASDAAPQETREQNKSAEVKIEHSNTDESPQDSQSSEVESTVLPPMENPPEPIVSNVEEAKDRAAASAEWSRQKEAELNQMLLKMMESKPEKQRGTNGGNGVQQDVSNEKRGVQQDVSNEKRGGFYSQYREKRDEKLRAEQAGKRAVKDAHFKVMKENLEQSKAAMVSKSVSATTKRDSPNHFQRPRRNSSPPVLPKKEVSKPPSTRKASPKTSPLPAMRSSWSAGPLPRTSGAPTPKTPKMVSTNSMPNCRKPLSTSSVTQPSPRTERLQQTKGMKGTPPNVKPSLKGQEEKKQRSVTNSSKSVKSKCPATPGDDSVALSAKPSFYNKVTKKSSVVPLESKPFLRKGTGTGPRGIPMAARPKVSQPDDSSKNSGNLIQPEENESSAVIPESTCEVLDVDDDDVQQENGDANLEVPLDNDLNHDQLEDWDQCRGELDNGLKNAELPFLEIQIDEDMGISSAAWVEVEREEGSASYDNSLPDFTESPDLASAAALSSPRVRHSLSQMLQADSNEPAIIEWGNAENPPALVYQKDAPKGFKRLLKFARKSKGEANVTGWASPSVFSEGEDDTEESKAASKRSSDFLLRKVALQAKGYEPPKSISTGTVDGGNSSNRSIDFQGMNEIMPAQSCTRAATILDRLREGQSSAPATSTKGAANRVRRSPDNAQHSSKSWWK